MEERARRRRHRSILVREERKAGLRRSQKRGGKSIIPASRESRHLWNKMLKCNMLRIILMTMYNLFCFVKETRPTLNFSCHCPISMYFWLFSLLFGAFYSSVAGHRAFQAERQRTSGKRGEIFWKCRRRTEAAAKRASNNDLQSVLATSAEAEERLGEVVRGRQTLSSQQWPGRACPEGLTA